MDGYSGIRVFAPEITESINVNPPPVNEYLHLLHKNFRILKKF